MSIRVLMYCSYEWESITDDVTWRELNSSRDRVAADLLWCRALVSDCHRLHRRRLYPEYRPARGPSELPPRPGFLRRQRPRLQPPASRAPRSARAPGAPGLRRAGFCRARSPPRSGSLRRADSRTGTRKRSSAPLRTPPPPPPRPPRPRAAPRATASHSRRPPGPCRPLCAPICARTKSTAQLHPRWLLQRMATSAPEEIDGERSVFAHEHRGHQRVKPEAGHQQHRQAHVVCAVLRRDVAEACAQHFVRTDFELVVFLLLDWTTCPLNGYVKSKRFQCPHETRCS